MASDHVCARGFQVVTKKTNRPGDDACTDCHLPEVFADSKLGNILMVLNLVSGISEVTLPAERRSRSFGGLSLDDYG